jgi:hypothetical protein
MIDIATVLVAHAQAFWNWLVTGSAGVPPV